MRYGNDSYAVGGISDYGDWSSGNCSSGSGGDCGGG